MSMSKTFLAGVAALALIACGERDRADAPRSEASAQAAKADAASPLDAEFRLKDAEPVDIDAFFAIMPPDIRPTYDSASFDEALGAAVVENLRFADADDGEGVLVERAEFYGLDMEAVDRITNAEAAGADAPFETVFQKIRFLNVLAEGVEDENTVITVGGVEFDTLEIRQGGIDGDGDEAARFFNGVNLAGLYFKDIAVKANAAGSPAVDLSAPDIRFVGLSGGKLSAMIANDLEYELTQTASSIAVMTEAFGPQGALFMNGPLRGFIAPDNQRTTMKSLVWRNIDFSGLVEWGLKGEEPPVTEEGLIDLGTMIAVDMETFIDDRRLAKIEETTLSAAEFTWIIPSNIRADSKGAVYDFTAYLPETEDAAPARGVLRDHGLDNVEGDGSMTWQWNSKKGDAGFDYAATANGLADFSMTMNFAGLMLDDIAAAQDNGDENAFVELGRFSSFTLTLKDEKALDAIFALSALQMGGTGEDLRQSAPALIRLSGAQAAQLNGRIQDYVNAVADFVASGGTLEIKAEPDEPIAFSTLQSGAVAPQTLPDVFDIEVTHTE